MAVPGARRLAPRRQRGDVRRRWRPRGGAGPRPSRRRASPGRCRRVDNFGVQVGCPKTPVKGKMPSKGSRRVGPTEVPAMRKPNPTPLSRTRTIDALPAMGKKKHHENFTGCTRRPCLKQRRGSCPSSPAPCRSSPRSGASRRRPRSALYFRPARCTAPTLFRYDL